MLFKRKGINTHLVLVDEDCDGCLGLRTERKNRSELLKVVIVLAIERIYGVSVDSSRCGITSNAWVRVPREFIGLMRRSVRVRTHKSVEEHLRDARCLLKNSFYGS